MIDAPRVAEAISASRKYRSLCADTVLRMAHWATERSASEKEAVKRAKRKLHQVYGAYLSGWNPGELRNSLERIPGGASLESAKPVCREIMGQHASTRERPDAIGRFYASIWAQTGKPARVLDLGCGLHPFALPWMGLPADVVYKAWDIDQRIADLVNAFFLRTGVAGRALCRDISSVGSADTADVVFLLKMIPCLEQQEKGWGARLFSTLDARHIVVSFPGRSLGGREKGMAENYARMMDEMVAASAWTAAAVQRTPELAYVLRRG